MFLHRNGPRQEIDIEFLRKDTSKMLVNVFYNPGAESTKLEYGYRGTPTLIDLGFDAADSFHSYEIDWQPDTIRWLVDGDPQPASSIQPQPLALSIEGVRREPDIGAPSGLSEHPISRDPQLRAYRDRRTG